MYLGILWVVQIKIAPTRETAMGKHNSHAPEITTHINDAEHGKGNIFEPKSQFEKGPMVKQGCYANAESAGSRQEKMGK